METTEIPSPSPTPIEAFEVTISRYQELAYSSGDLAATDYGQGAESGKATNTGSSSIITPSDSDYVCDVEIASRRALNWEELDYFNEYYKSAKVVVEPGDTELFMENLAEFPAVASLDLSMRKKLGARLIAVGIHPPALYMKTVDVRAPKPAKQRWSHLYGN